MITYDSSNLMAVYGEIDRKRVGLIRDTLDEGYFVYDITEQDINIYFPITAEPINKARVDTLNQAKAILEYHFRDYKRQAMQVINIRMPVHEDHVRVLSGEPEIICHAPIDCDEMMFYLYLPIKFPGTVHKLPPQLKVFEPLILQAIARECQAKGEMFFHNCYLYLTVKNLYSPMGIAPNRPGWHSDGFGSQDINYIYYSDSPTEFCVQEFTVSKDDQTSLRHFESQAQRNNIKTYPAHHLLRLTPDNIHRVPDNYKGGVRLFVKISVSENQYRLKGNSKNYLFDYDWEYLDRAPHRNQP